MAPRAGSTLAREFGLPFVVGTQALIAARPDVVVEAASHEAVREHAEELLRNRIARAAALRRRARR